MSLFSKSISGWFGYSRRERRASAILVFIVLVIVAVRLLSRHEEKPAKIGEPVEIDLEPPIQLTYGNDIFQGKLSGFDPNTADYNRLRRAGLSNRQARTLIKYRSRGGKFRTGTDILKVYGLDSSLAEKLVRFIKPDSHPASRWNSPGTTNARPREKSRRSLVLTDLNRCDSASLERLPAIGPVLASRIIKYRKLLGGFYTVEQLKEVYGVTDTVYVKVSPLLLAERKDVKQININSAGYSDFVKHPYFQRFVASSILKYRKLSGSIDSIGQLTRNRILDTATAIRIKPYLDFSHSSSGDKEAKF